MKKIMLLVVMLLTLMCSVPALAAESNLVGYVNVQQVFQAYPDIKTSMSVVDLEKSKAQKEFSAKAPSLDEKGKAELSNKLTEQVAKREQEIMEPIQQKIQAAISKAAKAKGITSVVNGNVMLFGGKDLTQDVIALISK